MYGSNEHLGLICKELRPKRQVTKKPHNAFWERGGGGFGDKERSLYSCHRLYSPTLDLLLGRNKRWNQSELGAT